jgi:hypothetical protein
LKAIKIELPKKYLNELGNYPQHLGKDKISYSQLGSFKDYKLGYLRDYILGVGTDDSGIFALYGGFCGKYFEDGTRSEYLTDSDIEVINRIPKFESSRYESEIVIDLEPFGLKDCVLQGFSDHEYEEIKKLFIDDLKTGNSANMQSKYGDMTKYYQTRLYAYQRENEGFEIGGCKVYHLGRKGNNLQVGDKNCLRLTGEIDYIETPYKREDVEDYLRNSVVPTCKEISEYYKIYSKIFAQ